MHSFLTLHHPARARENYEKGLWRSDTFYSLLRDNAAAYPDKLALQDGRQALTWAETLARADGLAAEMRVYGLKSGDRVSIWLSNRVEAILTFLACSREGFACNPSLHRSHTCAEIGTLLDRLSARILLTEEGWGADRQTGRFESILARIESLRMVFTPDNFPSAAPNLTGYSRDPDKLLYLAFTSGTTGEPKCVMHSDNTLLANARELVRDWRHGPDTAILSLAPLSHHIAWVAVAQWLLAAGRFITDDAPLGMDRLDWILETRATYVLGVPTHAMDILAEQKRRGLDRMGNVETFYMAGAPIPPTVAEKFLNQGIRAQNVYGMTENSSHQYTHPDDDVRTIVNTCGRGGSAYEVRIFDPSDRDAQLPRGQIGEIGGRGASLMLGYFDNQAATEASFNKHGWFMSGDLGVIDDAGNLKIEGRIKDVIIRGGHNIYPSHIEALAMRHRDVARAACFPIPDPRLGERVCIAITGSADPLELLEYLAWEGLSKYDMPEYFLRVDAFPLTASGKILKRKLVDQARRQEISPVPVRFVSKSGAAR